MNKGLIEELKKEIEDALKLQGDLMAKSVQANGALSVLLHLIQKEFERVES